MLAPRSRVFRDDSSLLIRLESADSTRVCFCDSSLCVTRVIIGSSQSQVKSFLVVTRVKSSHFGLPTRVKSSHHKMRLESTRVRVSDLTCYNTGYNQLPLNNLKVIQQSESGIEECHSDNRMRRLQCAKRTKMVPIWDFW